MDQNTSFLFRTPLRSKVLLGFLVGLLGIFSLSNYIFFELPLQNEGMTVEGHVTARHAYDAGVETSILVHDVTYSWEVDGRRFSSTVNDDYLYDNYREGDPITLVYLPSNPSIAKTEVYLKRGEPDQFARIGAVMVVGSLGYMIVSVLQARRSFKKSRAPI